MVNMLGISRHSHRVVGLATAILVALTTTSCQTTETMDNNIPQGAVVPCTSISVIATDPPVLELPCMSEESTSGDSLIDIGSIKGPALVNVWGSWCEPCVTEIKLLRDFYSLYSTQVSLIGVDIEEETATSGQEFVVSHGITWPQVIDQKSTIRKLSGVGVPTTLFIASDGRIAKTFVGPFDSLDQIVQESNKAFGIDLVSF
ncbi:MAG: redoxin domain-containing protein [Actinobacteria bacterium]|uniref:Unannotated protein n=1 Tax=freshwater metagenome TaxID=449393 RepID=A0A6J5ZJS5_9ZZZZ|nr:redoxin domain-containing protein [Actinomycetota bacterium]